MMMPWSLLKIMSQSLTKTQKIATTKMRPPQTAEDIVSYSLASGALSEVCEVTAVMRELDDKENDLVKEFVSQGCSASCDFGPKKTPCSMLFPVKHYWSLRATFAEMSRDEPWWAGLVCVGTDHGSLLPVHHTARSRTVNFTTKANVYVNAPSCSSTTLASRGSRSSRRATSWMDQLWGYMGTRARGQSTT